MCNLKKFNFIALILGSLHCLEGLQPRYNKLRMNTSLKNSNNEVSTGIPDMNKRHLMNTILLNSVYASCGTLLGGYLSFFYPKSSGGNGNGLTAKDKIGDDVKVDSWLKDHKYPSRELVQGLKGDPYYLITNIDNKLDKFALNAVCTHLGCVVPWNSAENKFMCPCHGSQYNSEGKVVRGPAPRSLALAKLEENDNKVILKEWTETDFRDGSTPWWI